MSETERKLCKDCRHFSNGDRWHDLNVKQDLVSGVWSAKLPASLLREHGRQCGPLGDMFEPSTEPGGGTLRIGTTVSKQGGDYRFDGTVVAVFEKLSGATRYVVEDDRGVLHIYSRKNLAVR